MEDPLFTSFTFDIDFNTSPLFYTIYDYNNDHVNVGGLADRIELALDEMHCNMEKIDQGYDILPLMSASFTEDGRKLGFGIQQNVYLDQPLYGATEYIYMVDKRNGGSDQNDVRYGNGGTLNNYYVGGNDNSNSFKLGDSVKTIVNESDEVWAERQMQQNENAIEQCNKILTDQNVIKEHETNKGVYEDAKYAYENYKYMADNGEEYTENQLENEIKKLKSNLDRFDKLKKDIVDWVNKELSKYQTEGTKIYKGSTCVQFICSKDYIGETEEEQIKRKYSDVETQVKTFETNFNNLYNDINKLLLPSKDGYSASIYNNLIVDKFGDRLNEFGLIIPNTNILNGGVSVNVGDISIDWVTKIKTHLGTFGDELEGNIDDLDMKIQQIMTWICDEDYSFSETFTSDNIEKWQKSKDEFENYLSNIKYELYGSSGAGDDFDKNNPSPDSIYGKYKEAEEKSENDEYSQAEKSKEIYSSGELEMSNMLGDYYSRIPRTTRIDNENNHKTEIITKDNNITTKIYKTPQTVLDILGFISGMRQMIRDYPYIIQGITGLDTAYNKHYGIKDPYLGSGEDKITLTCLESLDLRVSSMFNRYFNAIYDRQYRRERVPVNLRRFNCSVYVHDVRNFVSNMRNTENRIFELKDMYYSVIEFKFYDCEIVPEETGNIFNDISNEAPSEMKKTNFTFTYGNCVVNFNPSFSELVRHNQHIFGE